MCTLHGIAAFGSSQNVMVNDNREETKGSSSSGHMTSKIEEMRATSNALLSQGMRTGTIFILIVLQCFHLSSFILFQSSRKPWSVDS